MLDLGHGNWAQNDLTPLIGLDGKQPAPEWLPMIQVDDKVVYGQAPGLPSVPTGTFYPGQLTWSQRLPFHLGSWRDGQTHKLTVDIWAAQYFTGWGDHPADAWEWGYFNAKGEPAHLERSFTLMVGPPPPGPPNIPASQTWLGESINSLTQAVGALKQSYAWSHTAAASYGEVHAAAADIVQAAGQIAKAQAFLRGENP